MAHAVTRRARPASVSPHAAARPAPRTPVVLIEAVLAVVVVLLSIAVHTTRVALPGDLGAAELVQRLLPLTWISHPIEILSVIGWPIYQAAALSTILVALLLLRRRFGALALALVCGCGDGTSYVMNRLIQRPRPQAAGLVVDRHITNYYSFPSGHVIHFTILCGFLLFLTYHPRAQSPWWVPVRVVLVVWPLLMGLSRILTGEHWPSDVLAGYLVGLFWLIAGIRAYRWAAARWPRLRGRGDRATAERPERVVSGIAAAHGPHRVVEDQTGAP